MFLVTTNLTDSTSRKEQKKGCNGSILLKFSQTTLVEVTLLEPEGATIPDPGPTVTPEPEGPPSSPASGASPKPRATGTSITQ